MSLERGTRLGPYEIDSVLGAGGMGEVYRARDTRLKREVAIKVLPAAFARDPERMARFEREAELLATLNHPNIAAVYGFEETPAASGIVLELVEGPTLADRTAHGPIPIDEALTIARQIAEALNAAHEKNIIHRDLKPANIKVTPDGTVKVLDFGLAKMTEVDRSSSPSLTLSPTVAVPVTTGGLILGTAGYMSPEQARGKSVDRRSDIWSFGCVLFEMLTGRRAFDTGETVSDAVAAILTRQPDWSALPAQTPESVRRLLGRCLEKDPDRRLHHIADARLELDDADRSPVIVADGRRASGWLGALPWAVAAGAVLLLATVLWNGGRSSTAVSEPIRRLEFTLPAGVELFVSDRTVAVSADGSRIAFVGVRSGVRTVYVRSLDAFDATPVRGSEAAVACFFSPDGQAVAVVTNVGILKTISLADGLVTTVTDGANLLYGGAWSDDGRIVFVRSNALWQVPASGGTAMELTKLGGPHHDTLHAHPVFLPGGKTLLFGAASGDQWRIDSLVLATGERRTVVDSGTLPLYPGHGRLVFLRDGELLAAPFDQDRVDVTGPAVQVLDRLPTQAQGLPIIDVSAAGTLVYAPTTAVSRLVSVSRDGAEQPINDAPRAYANPRLSRDGSRLLVQAGDLWVQDLTRSTFTRLTTPKGVVNSGFPTWLDGGRRAIYRSPAGLTIVDVDGNTDTQTLAGTSEYDYPMALGPDGDTLVIIRSTQKMSFDILTLSLKDPTSVRPLLQTPAYEGGAQLSPDGKWLVYVSNESGQNEVYLRPFDGPNRRWTLSTQGGTQPVWNPNGREIFYRNGDRMMAVEMTTTPEVRLSTPRQLFEQRYAYGAGVTIANYDVTRDGQRFIMIKDESGANHLNIVLNWLGELNRQSPGR